MVSRSWYLYGFSLGLFNYILDKLWDIPVRAPFLVTPPQDFYDMPINKWSFTYKVRSRRGNNGRLQADDLKIVYKVHATKTISVYDATNGSAEVSQMDFSQRGIFILRDVLKSITTRYNQLSFQQTRDIDRRSRGLTDKIKINIAASRKARVTRGKAIKWTAKGLSETFWRYGFKRLLG